jgi:hypothetical protein
VNQKSQPSEEASDVVVYRVDASSVASLSAGATTVTPFAVVTQLNLAAEASRYKMAEDRRRRINKLAAKRSQQRLKVRRLTVEQVPVL